MTNFLEVIFTGKQGLFVPGHAYQIEVQQHLIGPKLTVMATHGYEHKRLAGMKTTYPSLQAFLADWQITKVVMPDYTDGRGPTP